MTTAPTQTNNSKAISPKGDKLNTLKALFERSKPSMAAVMPKHMPPERILKIALSAASRTPLLLQCTPESILLAVMQCAQLGLEPNTPLGLAYLVPYKNNRKVENQWITTYEAQFIPGYRGLVKLAHQSGEITTVRSRVVREGDVFEVELGSDERLVHRPNLALDEGATLNQLVAVYAVAQFKNGATQFEVMSKAQVDGIRTRSKASENGPWSTDYEEMARKTVLRRLCKSLPLSTELSSALEAQARAEGGDAPDYGEIAEVLPNAPELTAGNRVTSATDALKSQLRQQAPVTVSRDPGDDDEPPPFNPTGTDGGRGSSDDARGDVAEASTGAGAQASVTYASPGLRELRVERDEPATSPRDNYAASPEAWEAHLEDAEDEWAAAGSYHKRSGAFNRANVADERKRATVTAIARRMGGDMERAQRFLDAFPTTRRPARKAANG